MDNYQTNYKAPSWKAREECWKYRHRYFWCCLFAIILAFITYITIPNRYVAQKKIADEYKETDILLGLNRTTALIRHSIASDRQEGLNNPEIYAHILSSNHFCEEIGRVHIEESLDYYHYLLQSSHSSCWNRLEAIVSNESDSARVVSLIRDRIKHNVSSKFSTVLIQVEDQRPDVAVLIVDSVTEHLQKAIIQFRTQNRQADLAAAVKNKKEAEDAYHKSMRMYAQYCDAHINAKDIETETKKNSLQRELQTATQNYNKQCEALARAQALIQHATPSFTTLVNPTAPQKASSPILIVYLLLYSFLACVFVTWYTLYQRSYGRRAAYE